jgi:uncharacterized protein (DUF1499 family)
MADATEQKPARGTGWCGIGSWFAGLGLGAAAIGLMGARAGLSSIGAFSAFGIGVLICLVALAVLLIGLLLSKGSGGAHSPARVWGAFVAAAVLVAISYGGFSSSGGAPPIHDITTDIDNPPAFDKVIALREADGAQNPPEYAGAETAAQQQAAFPDLETLRLQQPRDEVFAAAEAAARGMGWEIVAADAALGRIEATETTDWFRFRDDVVIRISAAGDMTEVDIRSKSRVGMGDMGANAARIRAFLVALQSELG